MSCILYSKASYELLVQSQLFHNCFEQVIGRLCTQEEIVNWAFRLNVDAYCHRYKDGENDVLAATVDDVIDYAFTAAGDLENPDNLVKLLESVRYQCADIDHNDPAQATHFATLGGVIAAVVNSETPSERAMRHEQERLAAKAKHDAEVERLTAELKARCPWAKATKYGNPDASKNLKKELSLAFPGIKFSVTRDGSSLDVRYTDGPCEKNVEAIALRYKAGDFDGMTDCYQADTNPARYAQSAVLGTVRYVSVKREYALSTLETVAAWYEMAHGKVLQISESWRKDGTGDFTNSDWQDDQPLYKLLEVTAF